MLILLLQLVATFISPRDVFGNLRDRNGSEVEGVSGLGGEGGIAGSRLAMVRWVQQPRSMTCAGVRALAATALAAGVSWQVWGREIAQL